MRKLLVPCLISLAMFMAADAMSQTPDDGVSPPPGDAMGNPPPPPPPVPQGEMDEPAGELAEPGIEVESGEADAPWLENFTDAEGNAPDVSPAEISNWQPALLTVKRVKQYATACQYWLKMENRLPFKIRNLALRFSAYILGKGYEAPILYDTSIKSFSEMRPTDVQYRDIFFEYADCDNLDFIKVEDAGRCSVGNLTKFSAQSGDCARFIEVKENDLICIYLDRGQGELAMEGQEEDSQVAAASRRTADNPCGLVTQGDVDDLLDKFETSYETGDLTTFSNLFDENATINDGVGRKLILETYGELFRTTKSRQLKLGNRAWKPTRGGSAVVRFLLDAKIDRESYWGPDKYQVEGMMEVYLRGDRLSISSFLHQQEKNPDAPSPF